MYKSFQFLIFGEVLFCISKMALMLSRPGQRHQSRSMSVSPFREINNNQQHHHRDAFPEDVVVTWSDIELLDQQKTIKALAKEAKNTIKSYLQSFDDVNSELKFETLQHHLIEDNHFPAQATQYRYGREVTMKRKDILDPGSGPRNIFLFIDTNILLHHLDSLYNYFEFAEINNISVSPIISYMVETEIESQFKKQGSRNQEEAIAWLDNTEENVMFETKYEMQRACEHIGLCSSGRCGSRTCRNSDNKILSSGLYYKDKYWKDEVVMFTNDTNLLLKSRINGLKSLRPGHNYSSCLYQQTYRKFKL